MPSVTDVVNVAMRKIGQTPIVSLTDGSTTANAADDIYEQCRDNLLRMHPWNFATKRIKLAQSANAVPFEFDYAYPVPADWIRTVSVHNNDAGYGTLLYRMEFLVNQRVILCNADQCYLRYIYQVTDPNYMTADFRECLALDMARTLAITLASSNTMYDQLTTEFKRTLARARSTDGMGSFPELRPRGSWASARGGNKNDFFSDG